MALTDEQKNETIELLKSVIRSKFKKYNPETSIMPFHTRLLGKDRMALYSFIQSLNTTFGTSIFESVAISLAKGNFSEAVQQKKPPTIITDTAQNEIEKIMNALSAATIEPNKAQEIERIRAVCQKGEPQNVKLTKIDVYLRETSGKSILIDIKTAKPNMSGFIEMKRTLLKWVAAVLYENPDTDITTLIAIPYNPYEPEPYARWTLKGMLDLDTELLVGKEFWDFVGSGNVYEDLLDCFEIAGKDLRPEIDAYFAKFNI